MFLVQKSKVGSSTEYLANAEEQHNKYSVDFNSSKINDFLKDKNIKAGELTPDIYSKYLDQQNSHFRAKFIGRLSDEWNLKEYDKKTFTDLMSNKLPKCVVLPEGVKIKKNGNIINTTENAQTGTDTVSNAPKSVSIEFARGNKETKDKLVRALNTTTAQIFDKIEKQVKPSCKNLEYQDLVPGSAKLLITTFTHYENRGYIDENGNRRLEPNLHTHNELKNYAEFELYRRDKQGNRLKDENGNFLTEKKMLAIDPEEIFKRQLENSANFDTLLNSNLQKEGFKTEPADEQGQTFRLAGYTKEIENSLSTRRNEITNYMEEQKKQGIFYSSEEQAESAYAEYSKKYRQNTAITKDLKNADDILANVNETISLNISKEQFDLIDKTQAESKQKTLKPDLNKIVKCQAFETNGIIDETKIKTEIYKQVRFSQTFNSAEELENKVNSVFQTLQSDKLGENRIIKMTDGRYTRLDIALNEKALERNIEKLKSENQHPSKQELKNERKFIADFYKDCKKDGITLNNGQTQSLKLAIEQKSISMVIGDAGTGKTSSFIRGCNEFHTKLGRKVFGISVGTSTSKDLTQAKINEENCLNTKQFIRNAYILDKNTGTQKINGKFLEENLNTTIIFDEAGMCGSEDMRKITDFVKTAREYGGDTQLVLVGDHKQLSAVSYGNAFTNIQKQLDKDSIVRLEENTRQRNQVAKDIAEGYRDKDIDKVFKALETNDLLVTKTKQADINLKLVEDYLNDPKSKLIVCGLNTEIDKINDEVRKGLATQEQSKPINERKIDFNDTQMIEVVRKSGTHTLERKRGFCPGEEIVFLENSNRQQKNNGFDVSNNDRGIIKNITRIDDSNYKLTVDIKGRQIEFETQDYNNFNHCYAVSTHKSQGKTVDNLYHLGNASQARYQNSYVNGSRHKEQYKLYLTENQVDKYKQNAVREAVKESTLYDTNCQKAVNEHLEKKIKEEWNRKAQPTAMPNHIKAKLGREYQEVFNHHSKEIERMADERLQIREQAQIIKCPDIKGNIDNFRNKSNQSKSIQDLSLTEKMKEQLVLAEKLQADVLAIKQNNQKNIKPTPYNHSYGVKIR